MNKKKSNVNYRSLFSLIIVISNLYGCSVLPTVPGKTGNQALTSTGSNVNPQPQNISGSGFLYPARKTSEIISSGNIVPSTGYSGQPVNYPPVSTVPSSGNYNNYPAVNYSTPPYPTYTQPITPAGSSNPVGQTGGTSDIKERATFNGKIYDSNGNVIDGATVNARSVDPNVSWTGETQVTTNGAYVFRNAPIGARVEITVTKDGITQTITEVLKSNLQGDPRANVIDFTNFGSQGGQANISGKVYNGNGNLIVEATVTAQSEAPSVNWKSEVQVDSQGNYRIDNVPAGIKVRITVTTKEGKSKTREESITNTSNVINFGGNDDSDKTFAITSQQDNFFVDYGVNPFVDPSIDNLSTFSIDVDTASYTWMRKSIAEENTLPDRKSVRIEEFINYFDYYYPLPTNDSFTVNTDIVSAPDFNENKKIIRVGLQGKDLNDQNRKDAVLTFVIDVSGSMDQDNRLGLVKQTLALLVKQLRKGDKVGIVIFGTEARVLLEPKSVDNEAEILAAIDSLQTEGSTNTEAGLMEGFKLAQKYYKAGASNRVILCSDGVANVGETGPDAILQEIKQVNESGIALSTIGFGMGNYNDVLMEQLANKGNGYYSYVDNLKEAYRVFVENLNGSLQTIAKDVKVQVDFNPETVKQYRLLGYENRDIADSNFRNDKTDAGEVGLNTSVTALYEVELKNNSENGKIAEVFLRYKDTDDLNKVKELQKAIYGNEIVRNFSEASPSFRLAASVALFAEILRHSYWAKDGRLSDVLKIAREAKGAYEDSRKIDEFISLVEKAEKLQQNNQ